MRRAAIIVIVSTGLSFPAFGSETGTYRPGQAYNSVTANSPAQCAAQCQGDAQCKGWNFVRPRQMSRSGVCEFNANHVSPVPSQVSISGDNDTARASARIVSAGSRTVRVGALTPEPVGRATPTPTLYQQTLRPERQGLHQRAPQLAGAAQHRQPTAVRNRPNHTAPVPSPQFNYSLDGAPARQIYANATPSAGPAAAPRLQHQLDGGAPAIDFSAATINSATRLQHNLDGGAPAQMVAAREPVVAALAKTAPVSNPQSNRPILIAPQQASQVQMSSRPMNESAAAAPQSLYGSLYDDVTVPLVLTKDNMPSDPDAPIATVKSMRTRPVETSALAMMAGPPRN